MSAAREPADPVMRIRRATAADVPAIVRLLADDPLGATREMVPPPGAPPHADYLDAFAAIDANPDEELLVAEAADGAVVGTVQLTVLRSLSHRGAARGQIESVRVHRDHRGGGLGRRLIEHAIGRARDRGCRMVQLTSTRSRERAIAFYRRLGFVDSHAGLKLALTDDAGGSGDAAASGDAGHAGHAGHAEDASDAPASAGDAAGGAAGTCRS